MDSEQVIESVTTEEVGGVQLDSLSDIGKVAVMGAVKQLASTDIYFLGFGVGLLFGGKTALKAMGAIVGVGAIYNAAKHITRNTN